MKVPDEEEGRQMLRCEARADEDRAVDSSGFYLMAGGKREVRSSLQGLGSGLDAEQQEASMADVPWLVPD